MGPVPNGSDLKIVTDWPFVHTGPANCTINSFPIRSENWISKKAGPVTFLEPFQSQTDPSPCKHLDRLLLADPSPCKHLDRSLLAYPSPCKHLDWFLLVLQCHFESYNVYSARA